MRVLVIGATGYVASRLIPTLLQRGHHVTAGARALERLDRFYWSDSVDRVEVNVLDQTSITNAIDPTIETVIYLVHGMDREDFRAVDRKAAENLVAVLPSTNVQRLVYLSGIVPDIDREALSEHLLSRLEVEETLSQASQTVITLRAAMIIGAGSASFELMSKLTRRLPITVVPYWMRHDVEPISIEDLTLAVEAAMTAAVSSGHYDVGGGHRIAYTDLLDLYAEVAGINRDQLHLPFLPETMVAKVAARITSVNTSTAQSLIESLREDMVAADTRWISELAADRSGSELTSVREAIQRSLTTPDTTVAPSARDPLGRLPGDRH
ncbi:NAD(P)H-binding protein [Brevibacterium sp. GP-SGM9]|uniref:NAD(P)H-binding protein n=1 Tax=Brevibacterium sp. GP-SGM9 TaxID=3376990 RepID=UPI0039A61B47